MNSTTLPTFMIAQQQQQQQQPLTISIQMPTSIVTWPQHLSIQITPPTAMPHLQQAAVKPLMVHSQHQNAAPHLHHLPKLMPCSSSRQARIPTPSPTQKHVSFSTAIDVRYMPAVCKNEYSKLYYSSTELNRFAIRERMYKQLAELTKVLYQKQFKRAFHDAYRNVSGNPFLRSTMPNHQILALYHVVLNKPLPTESKKDRKIAKRRRVDTMPKAKSPNRSYYARKA